MIERVLIIDDEENIRQMLRLTLRPFGIEGSGRTTPAQTVAGRDAS